MSHKLRIMLADDHRLLRSGLKLLLQRDSGIEVVGEVSDGIQALKLYAQLKPDILILDLSMPHMDGIECLIELKLREPAAKVIVLTMHEDETYLKEVMKAGAVAYVNKSAVDTELFKAIQTVRKGEIYLSRQNSKALLSSLLKPEATKPVDANAPSVLLSPREQEVLGLLVRCYSLGEIAEKLAISIKTVDTYKVRLMEKLNVTKRSQLVGYALRYGLLTDNPGQEM